MTPRVSVCLVAVCWIVSCSLLFASEESAADEQLLRSAGIAANDRALLDFFRHQTADASTSRRMRQLIEQLGSDSFPVREKASTDLTALGPAALPLLRQSIRTTHDLEVRRRARDCAQQIENGWTSMLAAAAARLLAVRKPAGTAESLLAFLPGPYDEWVNEEIQNTLVAVARADGEGNAVFIRSLMSSVPARRIAAAVALCRRGAMEPPSRRSESWPAVRKLLQDREATVRLLVARELAIAGDRQAVPVLIDLIAQLPAEKAEQAEELLYRLAGPKRRSAPLGHDAAAQQKCRDAWRVWWRDRGDHVEMAVLRDRERQLGYTLLVLLNDNRVVEWDRDGKPRWQINGLASPLDAEVLLWPACADRRARHQARDRAHLDGRNPVGEEVAGAAHPRSSSARRQHFHRHAQSRCLKWTAPASARSSAIAPRAMTSSRPGVSAMAAWAASPREPTSS